MMILQLHDIAFESSSVVNHVLFQGGFAIIRNFNSRRAVLLTFHLHCWTLFEECSASFAGGSFGAISGHCNGKVFVARTKGRN